MTTTNLTLGLTIDLMGATEKEYIMMNRYGASQILPKSAMEQNLDEIIATEIEGGNEDYKYMQVYELVPVLTKANIESEVKFNFEDDTICTDGDTETIGYEIRINGFAEGSYYSEDKAREVLQEQLECGAIDISRDEITIMRTIHDTLTLDMDDHTEIQATVGTEILEMEVLPVEVQTLSLQEQLEQLQKTLMCMDSEELSYAKDKLFDMMYLLNQKTR